MTEWHITPEYIINNWTDEKFELMVSKLTERKEREVGPKPPSNTDSDLASLQALANKSKGFIKVVKKDGN